MFSKQITTRTFDSQSTPNHDISLPTPIYVHYHWAMVVYRRGLYGGGIGNVPTGCTHSGYMVVYPQFAPVGTLPLLPWVHYHCPRGYITTAPVGTLPLPPWVHYHCPCGFLHSLTYNSIVYLQLALWTNGQAILGIDHYALIWTTKQLLLEFQDIISYWNPTINLQLSCITFSSYYIIPPIYTHLTNLIGMY